MVSWYSCCVVILRPHDTRMSEGGRIVVPLRATQAREVHRNRTIWTIKEGGSERGELEACANRDILQPSQENDTKASFLSMTHTWSPLFSTFLKPSY